jgi:hypothetical protein
MVENHFLSINFEFNFYFYFANHLFLKMTFLDESFSQVFIQKNSSNEEGGFWDVFSFNPQSPDQGCPWKK